MRHSEYYINKVIGFLDKTIEDFPHDGYCDICIDWRIFTPVFPHLVDIFDGYTITYMGRTPEWVMFRFEDEAETLKEAQLTVDLHKQVIDINKSIPEDYDEDESEANSLFNRVMEEFFKELHKGNN